MYNRSCQQIIHFCSKSHQDLFYTFKEFDTLINHTVGCPRANARYGKQQNQQRQSLAIASSLSLPLPSRLDVKHKNINFKFTSAYDTLV